jgi:oligopeptide transport system substrate-binding protein
MEVREKFKSVPRLLGKLALCLLMGACGCRPTPPADLTILNGAEPSSLDPILVTGIEELRAVLPLFEGLTRPDPRTGEASPGLAERWEISSDGRVYTFHLRTNAVWSTGGGIDASDVVYSWRRALEPTNACQYASLLFPVRGAEAFHLSRTREFSAVGIRAEGPYRLRVELESPCAYFLDLCAFQTLSVVPREAIDRFGDRWVIQAAVPTSGPLSSGILAAERSCAVAAKSALLGCRQHAM